MLDVRPTELGPRDESRRATRPDGRGAATSAEACQAKEMAKAQQYFAEADGTACVSCVNYGRKRIRGWRGEFSPGCGRHLVLCNEALHPTGKANRSFWRPSEACFGVMRSNET